MPRYSTWTITSLCRIFTPCLTITLIQYPPEGATTAIALKQLPIKGGQPYCPCTANEGNLTFKLLAAKKCRPLNHCKSTTLNKNREIRANIAGATRNSSSRLLNVTLDQPLGFKPWFLLWTLLLYKPTCLVLHFSFLTIRMWLLPELFWSDINKIKT